MKPVAGPKGLELEMVRSPAGNVYVLGQKTSRPPVLVKGAMEAGSLLGVSKTRTARSWR